MPAFCWAFICLKRNRRLRIWSEIGRAKFAAVGVMMLCACFAAGQSSSSDEPVKAPAKKPATSKTTAPKHHTSTSKTSGSSATTKKSSSKTHPTGKKSSKKKSARAKAKGQQKIDSERAQAIQEALIREHYMTGDATGTWNQASEDAMRKYQADHGWQSKTVPDSRALIKLGLGPSKDRLLNPDSAMTTVPDAPKAASLPPTSHTPPTTGPVPATSSTPSDSSSPQ